MNKYNMKTEKLSMFKQSAILESRVTFLCITILRLQYLFELQVFIWNRLRNNQSKLTLKTKLLSATKTYIHCQNLR